MVETNKQKFNKRHGFPKDKSHSIADLAKISGVKKSILEKVKARGVAARKSNPQSVRRASDGKKVGGTSLKGKMSGQQWGQARVYSFLAGGKTRTTADKDLWKKHKESK